MWEKQTESGEWIPYPEEVSAFIESRPPSAKQLELTTPKGIVLIDLEKLLEISSDGTSPPVKIRKVVSGEPEPTSVVVAPTKPQAAVWQSQDPHTREWISYDEQNCSLMETAYQKKQGTVNIFLKVPNVITGTPTLTPFQVDFKIMEQKNTFGFSRLIRRVEDLDAPKLPQEPQEKAVAEAPLTSQVKDVTEPSLTPVSQDIVWESQDPYNFEWLKYDRKNTAVLEDAWQRKLPSTLIHIVDPAMRLTNAYEVDFATMIQVRHGFHLSHGRRIRRRDMSATESLPAVPTPVATEGFIQWLDSKTQSFVEIDQRQERIDQVLRSLGFRSSKPEDRVSGAQGMAIFLGVSKDPLNPAENVAWIQYERDLGLGATAVPRGGFFMPLFTQPMASYPLPQNPIHMPQTRARQYAVDDDDDDFRGRYRDDPPRSRQSNEDQLRRLQQEKLETQKREREAALAREKEAEDIKKNFEDLQRQKTEEALKEATPPPQDNNDDDYVFPDEEGES